MTILSNRTLPAFLLLLASVSHLTAATNIQFIGAPTVTATGTTYVFSNAGIHNAQNFDAVVEFTSFNNSTDGLSLAPYSQTATGNSLAFDLRGRASSSQHAEFNIRFVTSGSATSSNPLGTIFPINDTILIQSFDIDSNGGQDFTDVFGYRNSDSTPDAIYTSNSTLLEQVGFEQPAQADELEQLSDWNDAVALVDATNAAYTSYRHVRVGATPSWSTVVNADVTDIVNQIPITITLSYDSVISPLGFVWGATGSRSSVNSRGILINAGDPTFVPIPEPSALTALMGFVAFLLALTGRRSYHRS